MTLQIEVELGRVNHIAIHNGASRAVPAPIRDVGRREEPNVVTLSDNDNGYLRSNTDFLACR